MNTIRFGRIVVAAVGLWATVSLVGAVGCGGNDNTPKHSSRKGRVTGIDTSTGVVRMMAYNKDGEERPVVGTLASDAEILINGRTARLEDVQVDDPVEVAGRIERHDGETKLIALKVFVTRQESSQPAPETAASRPAR